MRTIFCWVLVWAHAWGVLSLRAAEPLEQAFQSAILAEEVRRDLEAAIRGYEGVVAQVDAQRAIAATAVFRLGECYRKVGRTNEAVAQYRRLLRDYPGESTLGRLSRENLLALGALAAEGQAKAEPSGRASVALSGPADEEASEIRRLQTLFERSPDLLNAPENEQTPLMTAAAKGQLAVVRALMGWGAKVDEDFGGKTALHVAAYEGHKAVVEALLDAKADPNARDSTGATPVSMAVMRGYVAVIETLLARGANLASDPGNSALIAAVESGRTNLIDRLVQAGADVNRRRAKRLNQFQETPLYLAVKTQQWDLARHLMRLGAVAVNPEGYNLFDHHPVEVALTRSAPAPDVDFARQLLRASPKEGFPPRLLESVLVRCVERGGGTERFILPLVEAGAPLEPSTGEKLLLKAMERPDPETLEQLLKVKADPNQADANGNTALHAAVVRQLTNHVGLLLGAGADPNRLNASGLTPLEIVRLGLAKLSAATRGGGGARITTASRGDAASRPQADGVLLQMQAMLLQAGAREDMARRLAIHRRKSGQTEVFHRRVGDDPSPSLADILLMMLRLQGAEWVDLNAIRVLRLGPDGRSEVPMEISRDWWQREPCTWSFPLEWGDVVELPEVDRVLGVRASGLSTAVVEALGRCSARRVILTIKGEARVLELRPAPLPQSAPEGFVGAVASVTTDMTLVPTGLEALGVIATPEPKEIDTCLLRDVLGKSGLLRVSSDLSRVRVTRKSSGRTATLDVEKDPVAQKYWLVEGDQIEVPEKPLGAE